MFKFNHVKRVQIREMLSSLLFEQQFRLKGLYDDIERPTLFILKGYSIQIASLLPNEA